MAEATLSGSTEEQLASTNANTAVLNMLDYGALTITDAQLSECRRGIFHSRGPGYFVIKNFIPRNYVEHLTAIWLDIDRDGTSHRPFPGKWALFPGCPEYVKRDDHGNSAFMNFFWNKPSDELTFSIAQSIQSLRARIEGRPQFWEMFPHGTHCVSYRVVITRAGETVVPMHNDWTGENWDPARTQATLYLTGKGQDYEGEGMVFLTNQGQRICFDSDAGVGPGDLVIWRYQNSHGVYNVQTAGHQRGFIRVLFPAETINRYRELVPLMNPLRKIVYHIRQSPRAMQAIGRSRKAGG